MEELVGIILLTFATIFGGIIMWKFFDIVRNSIKKNKEKFDDERFDRLAKAFIQHRKKTDKRLENIEAIITGGPSGSARKQVDESYEKLTIDGLDQNAEQAPSHTNTKGKQRID